MVFSKNSANSAVHIICRSSSIHLLPIDLLVTLDIIDFGEFKVHNIIDKRHFVLFLSLPYPNSKLISALFYFDKFLEEGRLWTENAFFRIVIAHPITLLIIGVTLFINKEFELLHGYVLRRSKSWSDWDGSLLFKTWLALQHIFNLGTWDVIYDTGKISWLYNE